MCKTNIQKGVVFTITVLDTVIDKIQIVQNSFIRLAIRLLKYVSSRLYSNNLYIKTIIFRCQASNSSELMGIKQNILISL